MCLKEKRRVEVQGVSLYKNKNMSSTEVLTENAAQSNKIWYTESNAAEGGSCCGNEGEAERGTCRKQKVILVGWDRQRGITFIALAASFVVWAAIYFPLTVK